MRPAAETEPSPLKTPSAAGGLDVWLRTTFASLAVRNFRLFFIGQGLSLIGTWMRRTAYGWFVFELTGSYELLGTIMALTMVPLFLFSPAAGALADRMSKRRLIVLTQILAMATSALVAVLIYAGAIQVWQLMVLAFVGGMAFAFEVPARQAFVVEMVGRDRLLNAIGLNSALVNAGRIVGPALAGFLMHEFGVAIVFVIDALSYAIVIGTLAAMRLAPKAIEKIRAHPLAHLWEGLVEVWRNPVVRPTMIMLSLAGVLGWSFQTLLPGLVQGEMNLSEQKYGILMAMFGVGAICAALTVAGLRESANRRRLMFTGIWIMALSLFAMSLWANYYWMIGTLMAAGFGGVMFISAANTLIQLTVADNIRGRVMGIWALGFGGSLPLGSWLAGLAAARIGSFQTIRYSGMLLFLFTAILLFRIRRTERAA